MCDTIGSTRDHRWRTEGFRVVSDNEKPLILQSLWKPKKGLARRFEIQRRSLIEEKTSNDKDTVTAGMGFDHHFTAEPSRPNSGCVLGIIACNITFSISSVTSSFIVIKVIVIKYGLFGTWFF